MSLSRTAYLELQRGKGYGPARRAPRCCADVNLDVERGEFVAIVGYSGAGKTTLISLIAGLLQPDPATVLLDGRADHRARAPIAAIVFQNYSLLPWLTVYENVASAVDQVFPRLADDADGASTPSSIIAMVNLTPARDKRPRELSGGMRQRVRWRARWRWIPEVLLLDEPLGALDALTRATLQDEIERIWERERKTVVLITNDVDEGILLADRIVPLTAGPRATLGPSFAVDLPRPRDRKALNHDPRFKEIRREVIDYLLASARSDSGAARRRAAERSATRAGAARPMWCAKCWRWGHERDARTSRSHEDLSDAHGPVRRRARFQPDGGGRRVRVPRRPLGLRQVDRAVDRGRPERAGRRPRRSWRAAPIAGPGLDRGVVFQSPCLLPWMTALDNVRLAVDQALPDSVARASARRSREHYLARRPGVGACTASPRSCPRACSSVSASRGRSR